MQLATFLGIGSMERKYVGKEERVLLIKVTLPSLDKYNLFHPTSLRSIFSNIGSYIDNSLNLAPKRSPKYFKGKNAYNSTAPPTHPNYLPHQLVPTLISPN